MAAGRAGRAGACAVTDEQSSDPSSREVTERYCDEALLHASRLRWHSEQARTRSASASTEMFGRADTAEAVAGTFTAMSQALEALAGRYEAAVDAAWAAQDKEDGVETDRRGPQ